MGLSRDPAPRAGVAATAAKRSMTIADAPGRTRNGPALSVMLVGGGTGVPPLKMATAGARTCREPRRWDSNAYLAAPRIPRRGRTGIAHPASPARKRLGAGMASLEDHLVLRALSLLHPPYGRRHDR